MALYSSLSVALQNLSCAFLKCGSCMRKMFSHDESQFIHQVRLRLRDAGRDRQRERSDSDRLVCVINQIDAMGVNFTSQPPGNLDVLQQTHDVALDRVVHVVAFQAVEQFWQVRPDQPRAQFDAIAHDAGGALRQTVFSGEDALHQFGEALGVIAYEFDDVHRLLLGMYSHQRLTNVHISLQIQILLSGMKTQPQLCEACANKTTVQSIHRLAKTWVRIASSVQSRQVAYSRINGRPPRDCTLEAMRTQASPDLCSGFK